MAGSGLLALLCLVAAITAGAAGGPDFGMSPARFWAGGFAAAPRIPLAGDADGDGRADLLVLYPQGEGIIDFAGTSAAGKPCFPVQARTHFGKDGLAAACGRFTGTAQAEVVGVFADGSVRLASDMTSTRHVYTQDTTVAQIPPNQMPKAPVRAVTADFDGGGRPDVLLLDAEGRILVLHNVPGQTGVTQFVPEPVDRPLRNVRRIAAGDLNGKGKAEIVWLESSGKLYRAGLSCTAGRFHLERAHALMDAPEQSGLAVGRFRGEKAADILIGQKLLPHGDAAHALSLPNLPDLKQAQGDLAWIAADFNGDGKDDLLRVRRSGERFTGDDLLVHFATDGKTDDRISTANDGLPDCWKTGRVKPGGLDLAALGCSPGHHDILVEVQPMADVTEWRLHFEMERVVRYYASLPVANPDGTTGIALHVLYREPIPLSDKDKSWGALGEKYHPAAHRGITHWMVISNGGGGQSGQMADRGSCGIGALYAVFLHEFGHQLGLDHTGHWGPNWCPTYSSLMNYAYSYQRGGNREDVGYSDGRLAGIVLDEHHLSERLPLPPDKLSFLAGPPYYYRMKPTPDGKGTLIDWNWNGVFGEENIAADINYGYSTSAGLRHTIGKTYTAPVLVAHGDDKRARLLLFLGRLPAGAPVPPADITAKQPGLSPEQPGRLRVRCWQGEDPAKDGPKWSEERDVEAAGVTGDPSAAYFQAATWVAYPTREGVKLRRLTMNETGDCQVGEATTIPNSQGAEPTLTPFAGHLALLLWRSATTPIALRLLSATGATLTAEPESDLGFASNLPVGAAEGAEEGDGPSLWIGLSQNQTGFLFSRWQVRRFVLGKDHLCHQVQQEWVSGEQGATRGSSRLVLLREPDSALGPQGQLYLLGCGSFGRDSRWACHSIAMRIADKTVQGGWLLRRYYDEWTQSRSAPGVCFFRGDIAFAARWFGNVHGTENDNLFVAFYGRGLDSEPMGDFDDIGFIRDVGMSHSIAYMAE
jgi:hypothetical protein